MYALKYGAELDPVVARELEAFFRWFVVWAEESHTDQGVHIGRTVPIGAIIDWPIPTPPAGWLKCDGAAVSRTTYAELFKVMGITFGVGDGSTSFNLPNENSVVHSGKLMILSGVE